MSVSLSLSLLLSLGNTFHYYTRLLLQVQKSDQALTGFSSRLLKQTPAAATAAVRPIYDDACVRRDRRHRSGQASQDGPVREGRSVKIVHLFINPFLSYRMRARVSMHVVYVRTYVRTCLTCVFWLLQARITYV